MDDIVIRAMARWPDVPAVYGWLSLDQRGRWLLRGEPIEHEGSVAFINRNYAGDEHGQWYFQNGPQRVFVALAYTPWVLRLDSDGTLVTHTGHTADAPSRVWLDDDGGLLLEFAGGVGHADDRDLDAWSESFLDAGGRPVDDDRLEALLEAPLDPRLDSLRLRLGDDLLPVRGIARAEVAAAFGFDPCPRDPNGD